MSDDPKCSFKHYLTDDAKRKILERVVELGLFKRKKTSNPMYTELHTETTERVKVDLVESATLNKVSSISGILRYTDEYFVSGLLCEITMTEFDGDIYVNNVRLADFIGDNHDDRYSIRITREG